jgi:S1-C subfamily serine protease
MGPSRKHGADRFRFVAVVGVAVALLTGVGAAELPRPGDDATYRPTVMIHRGKSVGTGTIIASVEGETLILTASHVVATETGPIVIELYRYNFGVEHVQAVTGFPRRIEASLIARDPDTDLAILRIKGQLAFPYVARIAKGDALPAVGTRVTTIGFDKGAKLIGFSTKVKTVGRIDLEKGGGSRPFIVTEDPPEVGRSGGGLFRPDGALVGVCIAKANRAGERTIGVFSTLGNVRDLIRANEDIEATMARAKPGPRSVAR